MKFTGLRRRISSGASWFAILALLIGSAAQAAAGEAESSRLRFGLQLGGAFPDDAGARRFDGGGQAGLNALLSPSGSLYEQLLERLGGPARVNGPVREAALDPVLIFHGFVGYAFSSRGEARLSLGIYRGEATARFPYGVEGETGPESGHGSLSTDITGFTGTADLRWLFPSRGWTPFVGGGVRGEHVSPGDTKANLAGVLFTAEKAEGTTYLSPVVLGGARFGLGGNFAAEFEAAVVGKTIDDPGGGSAFAAEPELRLGIVWTPGRVAGAVDVSEGGPPPPEEDNPPPPEDDLRPPPEKDGPCEWTRERFRILIEGFPLPDLDLFCKAAEACLDAARAEQARKDAEARLAAAQADLARTRKQAEDFARYLGSDAAARNQAGDPGLTAHYRKVTADYAQAIANGEAAVAEAEAAAKQAQEAAAAARAACDQARAQAEAEFEKLRRLQDAWKEFQVELARCVTCEDIEILDRRVGDILEKIRAARKACEESLLGGERSDLDRAEAAYAEASEQAAEDAAAHDAAAAHCRELADEVRDAYQDCVDRSLEGIDHVLGDRVSGYPMKRSLNNGLDDGNLGPVWFRSGSDRSRFYRALNGCLRARVDGRTTKPNVLTKRSDLRRCKKAEKRAWRKAQRSQQAADEAEAAVREARARLGDAADAFGPFDDLEAWAAAWSSFLVEAGQDCEIRVKRCQEVGREGEKIPPLPDDCDPGEFRDRAQAAAHQAQDASDTIDGLLWGSCGGGRAAVAKAENDAAQVLGDDGALAELEAALAEREAALADARRLLAEGRCEQAAAAYRKAKAAAQRAAEACRRLKKLVAAAETSAQAAADAADGCKQDDARRTRQEADRQERQAQEARARAAAAAQREVDARKAKEAALRQAIECWNHYIEWLIENLGEDQANEIANELAQMGQLLAETSAAAAQAMAEAAATGAPSAGISAAGISGGVFQLGVGLFYAWMQWEIEGAISHLDRKITLGRTQMELIKQRGPCGAFTMGSDKFFFIRSGNVFHVWRISEEPGLFGGTKHEYLGGIPIR